MTVSEVLDSLNKLCFDTTPLIYFVEQHSRYLPLVKPFIIAVNAQQFEAFSSVITLTEVLTQPIKLKNDDVRKKYRDILLDSENFNLIQVSVQIAERAAQLRAIYNLRTPDAIQIATALESRCDAFLTNDIALKRVTTCACWSWMS